MTTLAAVLAKRGISQDELVQRTGLTGRTVSHAYHGRSVSLRTWVKIAMALDIEPADLDPDPTEGRCVRSMTDASEGPGETLALTPLQLDILVLVVNGLTNREIADRLGLTPGLVGALIRSITRALGVTSRPSSRQWGRAAAGPAEWPIRSALSDTLLPDGRAELPARLASPADTHQVLWPVSARRSMSAGSPRVPALTCGSRFEVGRCDRIRPARCVRDLGT